MSEIDGDPALSPTSAGRLLAARRAKLEIRCEMCGIAMEATRRRRFCSNACSVRAWRRRRAEAAATRPILIVDLDPLFLDALALAFELSGFRVVTATNIAEAVQENQRYRPGLLILDHSGIAVEQLWTALAPQGDSERAPLVLMSARGDTEQMARSLGAVGFLTKPLDVARLVADVALFSRTA